MCEVLQKCMSTGKRPRQETFPNVNSSGQTKDEREGGTENEQTKRERRSLSNRTLSSTAMVSKEGKQELFKARLDGGGGLPDLVGDNPVHG